MKKILLAMIVMLAILAVSCDQSSTPSTVTVINESGVPVFWQLRKATDPESDVYLKIERGVEISMILDAKTYFILSYAGLATDNTSVTSDILVINQTSDDIRQMMFETVLPKGKIIFDGNSADLGCRINFKPALGF